MYKEDGSHQTEGQPKVPVRVPENGEYPIGQKPMEDKPHY